MRGVFDGATRAAILFVFAVAILSSTSSSAAAPSDCGGACPASVNIKGNATAGQVYSRKSFAAMATASFLSSSLRFRASTLETKRVSTIEIATPVLRAATEVGAAPLIARDRSA